jgi:hypothetical protein
VALIALVAMAALVQTIQFGRRQRGGAPDSIGSVLAQTITGRELSWVERVLGEAGVDVEVVGRNLAPGAYPWDTVAAVTDQIVDSRGRVRRISVEVERGPRPPLVVGRPHSERCVSGPGRTVRGTFGPVLGEGPVYLGGPTAGGVLRVAPGPTKTRRSYVFLIALPSYPGPLLVRGGRWGRPGAITFEQAAAEGTRGPPAYGLPGELHLPPGDGLRAWGATLTFLSPGCHALQIDGPGLHEVIVFRVEDQNRE